MAIFQWDRSCHFVFFFWGGGLTLYWIVISSKMPYVTPARLRAFMFNTKDFWTVPWMFPISQLPLQNHLILATAGTCLLQRAAGWVPGWGHCREVWGLWTMHWKERRGGMARFWTPLLEVEKRPMYCQENQKSLLLTCTFISSIRVWAILLLTQVFAALGLGLAYGSMHSFVLAQGASPTLPACFLPPTNRRADCTIYNSLWNQLFRCQVEGKAEGN